MKCFVIMPFAAEFNDVYSTIQRAVSATQEQDVEIIRLDEVQSAGRISDDLVKELKKAQICIADLTGSNPSVMWEVGYATALGKPVLFISQNVSNLPFDIQDMRTIPYDRQSLANTLEKQLLESFDATLGAMALDRQDAIRPLPEASVLNVAVTGSMSADHAQCIRRLETLLHPYLNRDVTWYCGSFGDVDQVTSRFLADRKEKVVVVGYHANDISREMLDVVEEYKLPFVDASREQLPKGFRGPSDRDVLFFMRADVVFLLWNGRSKGTEEMIDWYRSNEKDHVIGFVGGRPHPTRF